ncbi:MAG TPA: hypothetical protein VJT72_22065 [Pseudonocardiaceae bacterium]|nr:hypothetical protein [Pseudonocardiaceae bacterium]
MPARQPPCPEPPRTIISATTTQGTCTVAAPTVTCLVGALAENAINNVTPVCTITGTAGNDILNGTDTINAQDSTGSDIANGDNGTDTCTTDPADITTSC